MSFFDKLGKYLICFLQVFCFPIYVLIFSEYQDKRFLKNVLGFVAGFSVGQVYYYYLLKDLPFLSDVGFIVSLIISIFLGLSNAVFMQVRCMLFLLLPMYCGKAGRGVLKAIVLTYVVAGPITNMGLNAQEVVRVFACSEQLSYNLSKIKYNQIYHPINKALLKIKQDVNDMKRTLRSISEVISPVEFEIEGITNLNLMEAEIKFTNKLFNFHHDFETARILFSLVFISYIITSKRGWTNPSFQHDCRKYQESDIERNQAKYVKKMYYRCENHLSHAISLCLKEFSSVYDICKESVPIHAETICSPLKLPGICDLKRLLKDICNSKKQIDPGLGEGYTYLKRAKHNVTNNIEKINLQTKILYVRKLYDVQDAKETGDRVIHAFKEKYYVMKSVINIVNFCLALLFLRIMIAAQTYHDLYLTIIDFDNVYITEYFKNIDKKREKKGKFFLLPLNKMERNRYIDVHSTSYIPAERSKLLTQILKVMLEAITATTFIMLDRLFFEALDVVRQHAMETDSSNLQDIDIKVEGKGIVSNMMRKILKELSSIKSMNLISRLNTETCFPHPRSMPTIYYIKIYGGYLWILLLLYINPYTLRIRRLICSYFYPLHEKQRILHLYNDILKKRMKMKKTLRRKAVQAVRAYYLSGENLLSLRLRFPNLLGWLSAFPAARMKCLICEETEPRKTSENQSLWQSCRNPRCPFVLCAECSAGGRGCLACDPALALLSDIDSLSDDPPQRY